jgi:hypothetical protein
MAKTNKSIVTINKESPMGFVLFVAFIGAAVYFVQQSEGFWGFILALLKAAVWPAFLIQRAFELLSI